jgi:hypothetical protein
MFFFVALLWWQEHWQEDELQTLILPQVVASLTVAETPTSGFAPAVDPTERTDHIFVSYFRVLCAKNQVHGV